MDATDLIPMPASEIVSQILLMVAMIPLLILGMVAVNIFLFVLSGLLKYTAIWLTRLRINILTSLSMLLLGLERYFFGVSCTIVIRLHELTDVPFLFCRIVVTLVFFATAVALVISTTASARFVWHIWKTRGNRTSGV